MTNQLLKGKRGLIMGVANQRSIAWGIAQACADAGAELAFTYQGEVLERRVKPLAQSVNAPLVMECDVTDEASMDKVFQAIEKEWGKLDFVVHAIAYAGKEALSGRYVDTTAADFAMSLNISCYSFTAIAARAEKLMSDGGSMITLSYYGAEKAVPNYNVMGVAKAALEASVRYLAVDLGAHNIRVNAISAGPIKTLAASGVAGFRSMLKKHEENVPLQRNITIEDVGGSALYFLSDLSAGVTGEVHHVDSGYHASGMTSAAKEE